MLKIFNTIELITIISLILAAIYTKILYILIKDASKFIIMVTKIAERFICQFYHIKIKTIK